MPVKPHDDHTDEPADRIVASMTDLAGALQRLNDLIRGRGAGGQPLALRTIKTHSRVKHPHL
ncbi:hypothetical protein ACGFNP_46310 [Nonomuraea sp. NPDC049269]|uniref:hypothetical protein n=1 Tax=Nonomuraea sp. NPDC049269 TaxID=3364349 RepID=UPI00371EE5E4